MICVCVREVTIAFFVFSDSHSHFYLDANLFFFTPLSLFLSLFSLLLSLRQQAFTRNVSGLPHLLIVERPTHILLNTHEEVVVAVAKNRFVFKERV